MFHLRTARSAITIAYIRIAFLSGFILLYGCIFSFQERQVNNLDTTLGIALPASFHKIVTGYLKQLTAEMIFIRTSVFLGSVHPGISSVTYEEILGNNFEVMTQLYPDFRDPYFFCQAFLTPISQESAAKASQIFDTGITAYPNDISLRFFHAANFFLTMNEPLKGAKAFAEAAKLSDAPPLFSHLAALLSAQGGDISAGLISLRTLLSAEKDEVVRTRYQEEIVIFEKALEVQQALNTFTSKYGFAPQHLEELVPDFLQDIPNIKDTFVLVYDPPNLHLKRPDRKK